MNILINCSNLKIGGGLQVAHSFIYEMANNKDHRFIIVCSSNLFAQINISQFPDNFSFFTYDIKASALKSITGIDEFLSNLIQKEKVSVVFSVFGPTYWKPIVKHFVGYAKPHYVYIDSPFFKNLGKKEAIKLKIKKFFHLYDFKHNNYALITENKDVSNRIAKIIPGKKVYTVTNYYNQVFDNPKNWENNIILPDFDGFTLLTVSANYPHKNLKIIPDVIKYLKKKNKDFNFRFVLTLSQNTLDHKFEQEILDHILFVGKTMINQVPGLYAQSDATFLPTLLECFTATYPESMRMEMPILTSDLNFAKGLCEEAAIYFDPLDAKDIGDKILSLASDAQLRNKLVENGKEQLKKYDNYNQRANKYLELITNETNNTIL